MIPEAAVEAAARASFQFMEDRPWKAVDPDEVDFFRDAARKALEAAAPHLLATVSSIDELVMLDPGTVLQGPDFHEETYKCTAPGTFHAIAAPTEYRASELVGRGPFKIIWATK